MDPTDNRSHRRVAISINRRLVLDGLAFARRVPLFPAERLVDLGVIASLRKQSLTRISWPALFMKAFGIAAQHHPPLRRSYIRWPWPHFQEEAESTAMVVVNRQYRGEDRICWARIDHTEKSPLVEIQRLLDMYKSRPVDEIYRRQVTMSRLPTPLRRLLYWWNLNFSGRKRTKRLGTFTLSTLAGEGTFNRMHQTVLTSSLTYGPLDSAGRALVTLLCDHRVVDGIVAARALADIEAAFKHEIAQELRSLAGTRAAA
jgi:hypothetical protein